MCSSPYFLGFSLSEGKRQRAGKVSLWIRNQEQGGQGIPLPRNLTVCRRENIIEKRREYTFFLKSATVKRKDRRSCRGAAWQSSGILTGRAPEQRRNGFPAGEHNRKATVRRGGFEQKPYFQMGERIAHMAVEISLTGKNAIVTGGARGMGFETAKLLAQAGANVMICDINGEAAEKAAGELASHSGVRTLSFPCDVTKKGQVEDMVSAAVKAFGRIDILNHIAGTSTKVDFLEMTEDVYDLMMDLNAKGTFLVDQAVLRVMVEQKAGKIVNMSSMSGKEGYPTNVAYTASKFAVTGMTQAIAKYAAPYHINVNCVCPGIVRTQIWERLLADVKEAGGDPDAYWDERIGAIPLKRPQTMEDIAHMFLYLSSSWADNMTGQAINVTGGLILH